jgi:AcrR family transcriptional regulator
LGLHIAHVAVPEQHSSGPDVRARQQRRAGILDALAELAGERGYPAVTLAAVCARAGVSRGAFQREFASLQDCFLEVIDEGYRRADALFTRAFEREEHWQDGIRRALASLLVLFEEERAMARVWLVETLAAGCWALERRERHMRMLTEKTVARWPLPDSAQASPIAANAVMESVWLIAHAHALTGEKEPLILLLAPLMSYIAAVYLGPTAASAEAARSEALAREIVAERRPQTEGEREPVASLAVLRDPRAHRARQCLLHLAVHPGASNWQVARATGISGQPQVSRLLARLRAQGLLLKREGLVGHPNAWSLTPLGARAAQTLMDDREPLSTVIAIRR